MNQKRQSLNLQELVDLYEAQNDKSEQQRQTLLLLILTHQEIKSSLKNQSLILKRIFTYSHLATLIEYLKEENQAHAEELKNIKYDPSGQIIPLCLKLPFMAMEILCCECQLINELLFVGTADNSEPLLPKLLQFLDHPQHYHLACYFSKVMSAITKRVASTSHKYNPIFSKWIFGENEDQVSLKSSCLYKSIKHFYSLSTLDYVSKWLLLSSKDSETIEIDGKTTQKSVINFRKSQKLNFLIELIKIVNKNLLDHETITNIAVLFDQMLTYSQKTKNIPGLGLKPFGPSVHAPKATLYDFAVEEQVIALVFEVPDEGCLTIAKLNLIKVYLVRYICELQSLKKQKEEENQPSRRLIQTINSDNLFYVFQWMIQNLKIYLRMTTKDISSENSPHIEQQTLENSRVTVTSSEKMMILQICELVRVIHSIQYCKIQLTEYYNEHSSSLVSVIKRLMSLQNNLIQLQTSKIVLSMIRPMEKYSDVSIPYDFARKLLLHSILQLIDQDSIRAHVLEWADILLSLEISHIFQDYEEEFEWEHIREIVEQAKSIHIGAYRMIQGNIDSFYSEEKAQLKYSHFLHDYRAVIQYEGKGKPQPVEQKQKKRENVKPASVVEDGESAEMSYFFFSDPKNNYLSYNVDELISDL